MFIFFLLLILMILFTQKIYIANQNTDYLSRDNTAEIKGIFIYLVFLSHFKTYATFNFNLDLWVIDLLGIIGQLMVTMFLFCSGYGVFEAIKRKGQVYIDKFPINRIGKTFFDFAFSIVLFIILGYFTNRKFTMGQIALSFTGWTSVGNSNWYMFAIFSLYITTYLSFKLVKKHNFISLCLMSILSLIYVYTLSKLQPDRFSNTYLCYGAGMWYSFYKDKLDTVLQNKPWIYYISLIGLFALFIWVFPLRGSRIMMYNIVSIIFCILITFILMKVSLKSKGLIWLGNHLFWIYILQRIPMIILSKLGFSIMPLIYLTLCAIITIILAIIIDRITAYLKLFVFR